MRRVCGPICGPPGIKFSNNMAIVIGALGEGSGLCVAERLAETAMMDGGSGLITQAPRLHCCSGPQWYL